MAKCDLLVELDEPNRVYRSGDKVEGTVKVTVDADVKCSGLVLSTGWKTHGRGNVTGDKFDEVTVFSGDWVGGTKCEYRFSLTAGDWPQTYHGNFLSIDHYVEAQAKIPWAFDPKTATPFIVQATQVPSRYAAEVHVVHEKSRKPKVIGGVIVSVLVGVQFLAMGGIGVVVLLVLAALAFSYWFVRKFLPKHLLGTPHAFVEEDTLPPGSEVVGEFVTTTRKTVSLNAITVVLKGTEVCISGSGSNRRTHKNVIFETTQTLQANGTLQAGNETRCPFSFRLPKDAAFSISLKENSLIWSVDVEVDIPRWPDWSKNLPICIVPSSEQDLGTGKEQPGSRTMGSEGQGRRGEHDSSVSGAASLNDAGELTFGETINQLWAVRSHRDQVEMVVDAVTGISFNIEAQIERRLLYAGDEDPNVYEDGYAVWARYPDPRLPLVLYVPHDLGDEFEQLGKDIWKGRGVVVGWDSLHGRLQIKLDSAC